VQAAQGNDLLRPHEAARRLGVPLRDVYAAVRDGHLPSTRIGRFLWFRGDDVDAFAEASRRAAPKRRRP
jgi:excisionase family DNA binding protein